VEALAREVGAAAELAAARKMAKYSDLSDHVHLLSGPSGDGIRFTRRHTN